MKSSQDQQGFEDVGDDDEVGSEWPVENDQDSRIKGFLGDPIRWSGDFSFMRFLFPPFVDAGSYASLSQYILPPTE